MTHFHVRVAGDDLVFSAAHFIMLESGTCEPLHGHNYRVAAEVHGPLSASHYVVDFQCLKRSLQAILGQLDHRVLLPTESSSIRVAVGPREVEVACADRRWVFPRGDCLLLPMASTTAERLAEYVAQRLIEGLAAHAAGRPERLRVEVEECFGQWAVCELRPS